MQEVVKGCSGDWRPAMSPNEWYVLLHCNLLCVVYFFVEHDGSPALCKENVSCMDNCDN